VGQDFEVFVPHAHMQLIEEHMEIVSVGMLGTGSAKWD
jgi:hypothetical protein